MSEGTYAELMEAAEKQPLRAKAPASRSAPKAAEAEQEAGSTEDLSTTPYISQNYRFTEDELRWLRKQAYSLTERLGTKVSQNTILRFALHALKDACARNPKRNPLIDALSRPKK